EVRRARRIDARRSHRRAARGRRDQRVGAESLPLARAGVADPRDHDRRAPVDGDRFPGRPRSRARHGRDPGTAGGMKRWYLPGAAALGIGVFAWAIYSVGPAPLLWPLRAPPPPLPPLPLPAPRPLSCPPAPCRP